MDDTQAFDPFISTEPGIEVDAETMSLLRERIQSANEGRLVSAEVVRQRIQECISNSAATRARLTV